MPFQLRYKENYKKLEAGDEMYQRGVFLKVKRHVSLAENSSSNRGVRGRNALKDTPRKRACVINDTEALHKRSKL